MSKQEYPPLPEAAAIHGFQRVYTADQMRAYVDAALAQQSARHTEELLAYEVTVGNLRAACDKYSEAELLQREQAQPVAWIETAKKLPPDETPVLLLRKGEVAIGQRVWEHPGHEDNFSSFWFWADVNDHWHDDQGEATVTHWMYFPSPAAPQAQPERKPMTEEEIIALWGCAINHHGASVEAALMLARHVEKYGIGSKP